MTECFLIGFSFEILIAIVTALTNTAAVTEVPRLAAHNNDNTTTHVITARRPTAYPQKGSHSVTQFPPLIPSVGPLLLIGQIA